MEESKADGRVLNIGSGSPVTIREVAGELARTLGTNVPCDITGKYRAGDVRHCFADISAAAESLGYTPQVGLKEGIAGLAAWLESQQAKDNVDEAMQRLEVHGLVA
jgi:dTDP-L-rhamnose 4-epimerase